MKNKSKEKKYSIIKKVLFISLCIVIFFQFFYLTASNNRRLFSRGYEKEYPSLKDAYYSSQYAKKNPKGFIPDETFEAFAAGAFLKGLNPIHIVHDHPPLGRYLLSVSIIIFDNPRTIILFFLLASFTGIFLITNLITKNIYFSLIPVAIFANEPLTLNKLVYVPLPEPVQLPFIIFSFYFFLLAINSKKKVLLYSLVSLMLGFVISIRFFVTGGLILFCMMFYLIIINRNLREAFVFGATLPISIVVLILSYLRTIFDGYTIFQVFSIQKYILVYHKSAFTNAFSFWDLILFNRWHTWWGKNEILSDSQWRIYWPITLFISTVQLCISILKKINLRNEEKVIYIWVFGYSLMLSAGYTSTRYFFPLLPFIYILGTTAIYRLVVLLGFVKNWKSISS